MSMSPPRRPGVACSGKRRVSGLQQYLWVQDETRICHLALWHVHIFEKCRRHLSYIETPLLSSESHLMQLEGDSCWHPTEQHATREESSLGPGHDVGQSVIPVLGHKDLGIRKSDLPSAESKTSLESGLKTPFSWTIRCSAWVGNSWGRMCAPPISSLNSPPPQFTRTSRVSWLSAGMSSFLSSFPFFVTESRLFVWLEAA